MDSPQVPMPSPSGNGSRIALEEAIVAVLKTIYDPEIPVDIYELGLIYGVEVGDTGDVAIKMTLTAPACPAAGMLPPEVETKVAGVAGVRSVQVELVWDPPWSQDRMSEVAKLRLGFL